MDRDRDLYDGEQSFPGKTIAGCSVPAQTSCEGIGQPPIIAKRDIRSLTQVLALGQSVSPAQIEGKRVRVCFGWAPAKR